MRHHTSFSSIVIGTAAAFAFGLVCVGSRRRGRTRRPHLGRPRHLSRVPHDEATDVHGSVMYQWQGESPEMVDGPGEPGQDRGRRQQLLHQHPRQLGRLRKLPHRARSHAADRGHSRASSRTSTACSATSRPIDANKVDGVFVPDVDAMTITMDEAVQTVHEPERYNCLQCHAKAGGGDAVKRGDLTLAHVATTDSTFDVHMATTGDNLQCQDCHTATDHRVAGRGSDLRPTDSARGPRVHQLPRRAWPRLRAHEGSTIDRHVARVACQTCHIPRYAKDASDSAATEATETHRTWLSTHSQRRRTTPLPTRPTTCVPVYRFWNRLNRNYLLDDTAVIDPVTGRYPDITTDRSRQPVREQALRLQVQDGRTTDHERRQQAHRPRHHGLFRHRTTRRLPPSRVWSTWVSPSTAAYSWVETDTLQMLNHEVAPRRPGPALRRLPRHSARG